MGPSRIYLNSCSYYKFIVVLTAQLKSIGTSFHLCLCVHGVVFAVFKMMLGRKKSTVQAIAVERDSALSFGSIDVAGSVPKKKCWVTVWLVPLSCTFASTRHK